MRILACVLIVLCLHACTKKEQVDAVHYADDGIIIRPAADVPPSGSMTLRHIVWMYDHGMHNHSRAMMTIIKQHCSRNPFNKRARKDLSYCIKTMK